MVATQTSNNAGNFTFNGVAPGVYTVMEQDRAEPATAPART